MFLIMDCWTLHILHLFEISLRDDLKTLMYNTTLLLFNLRSLLHQIELQQPIVAQNCLHVLEVGTLTNYNLK